LDYLLRRHGHEKIILIGMLVPAGKCSLRAADLIARCVIAEAWRQSSVEINTQLHVLTSAN
jgi:hypothetical protein